jgi:hypothetical protein
MSHILVDLSNTFYRARFSINGDVDLKLGMAFHITLHSIKKAWEDFDGSHVVVFLEGRSWRKDFYPEAEYKANRSESSNVNWDNFHKVSEEFKAIRVAYEAIRKGESSPVDDFFFMVRPLEATLNPNDLEGLRQRVRDRLEISLDELIRETF